MDKTAKISEKKEDIIFFDGVCNLCNSSVNFVIDHDDRKRYTFASLQSDFAREELFRHEVDPHKLESIILLREGRVYKKSGAALEIARHLDGFWPVLYILKFIPPFIRDFFYDIIARNRYLWFGKQDSCRMPTAELRERFLDSYNVS